MCVACQYTCPKTHIVCKKPKCHEALAKRVVAGDEAQHWIATHASMDQSTVHLTVFVLKVELYRLGLVGEQLKNCMISPSLRETNQFKIARLERMIMQLTAMIKV